MVREKHAHAGLLLISTTLGALGQIFFKMGVTSALYSLVAFVLLGALAYLASSIVYFYVLSRTHLGWAYGFTGLSYIFASAIAFLFLSEPVPLLRWVGILVIAAGTVLIGTS